MILNSTNQNVHYSTLTFDRKLGLKQTINDRLIEQQLTHGICPRIVTVCGSDKKNYPFFTFFFTKVSGQLKVLSITRRYVEI